MLESFLVWPFLEINEVKIFWQNVHWGVFFIGICANISLSTTHYFVLAEFVSQVIVLNLNCFYAWSYKEFKICVKNWIKNILETNNSFPT